MFALFYVRYFIVLISKKMFLIKPVGKIDLFIKEAV